MTLQVRRGGVFVPTDGWTPPAEWLPLPATTPGTPAFHGLVAVSPAYHWATVYAEGDFTVDWGDGRVEDFDSTTLATHTYDYASLPGDPFRGYRQAVVSVTPQAGQQLTSLDLAQGHPDVNPVGLTGEYALTPWLDIRIEGPDLTFISTDNLGYYYVTMLERAIIGDLPALVVGDEMFAYSNALRYLKIGAMPALTSFYYLVGSSYALNYLELGELPPGINLSDLNLYAYGLATLVLEKVSGETLAGEPFSNAYGLHSVRLGDLSGVTSLFEAFAYMYSVGSVELGDLPACTTLNEAFISCYALESVKIGDLPVCTDLTSAFAYSNGLASVELGDMPAVATLNAAFENCSSLTDLTLGDMPALTDLANTFNGCSSLVSLHIGGASRITPDTEGMLGYCYVLGRLTVGSGFDAPTDLSNCWFDREGVLGLFYSLGTVSDSPTITLSSHPDNANLTPDDLAIATDKGWVIAFP